MDTTRRMREAIEDYAKRRQELKQQVSEAVKKVQETRRDEAAQSNRYQ